MIQFRSNPMVNVICGVGSAHDRAMYKSKLNDMYGGCNNIRKTQMDVFPPLIRYACLLRLLVLNGHLHFSDVWSIALLRTKRHTCKSNRITCSKLVNCNKSIVNIIRETHMIFM